MESLYLYLIGLFFVSLPLLLPNKIQSSLQYYSKLITLILSIILTSCFFSLPLFLLRSADYRNANIPAWSYRWTLRICGATFEVRGKENIDTSKGGVVVMNHQSVIDLAVLAHLWPIIGKPTVVVKKEMRYLCPSLYLCGTLFIDRENGKSAITTLRQQIDAIKRDSKKLLIFPEGTLNPGNDTLLPFKKGAFHIAVESQSSIQPVVTSKLTFFDSKKKIFTKGHTVISVLPEISCKGLTEKDVPLLVERTQKLMQEHFTLLKEELI